MLVASGNPALETLLESFNFTLLGGKRDHFGSPDSFFKSSVLRQQLDRSEQFCCDIGARWKVEDHWVPNEGRKVPLHIV